jgi:hypothetical protein
VPLKSIYEKMKPMIESDREHLHNQRVFEHFEYLYNEMKKREKRLRTSAA